MKNFDLVEAMRAHESVGFDAREIAKLNVKLMHLLMTKLHMIRDSSHSARRRESLLDACDTLQGMICDFQSGALDVAISNADRATLLTADVEMARFCVALVLAQSSDPNQAFWLVGSGSHGIDLSGVLKE